MQIIPIVPAKRTGAVLLQVKEERTSKYPEGLCLNGEGGDER